MSAAGSEPSDRIRGLATYPVLFPFLLRQLPCGRHGLAREVVAASQRARLLEAALVLVGGEGYAAASAVRVSSAAGVSPTTFYQHFQTKEDCVMAACDVVLGRLLKELCDAVLADADWARGVGHGLRCLLSRLAAEPHVARVCFVELRAADLAGPQRHVEAIESLAVALRPPRRNPKLPEVCEEVIAGGVWNTIHATIVKESPAALPRLLPALHHHVLVYHLGPVQADQISRLSV